MFWRYANRVVWISVFVLVGATVYSNYLLPHGSRIDTGETICSDDGGSCHEKYVEDTSHLNIPGWAKLVRSDGSLFVIGALCIGGFWTSAMQEEERTKKTS